MTLGDNPGVSDGPPVALGSLERCERFSSVSDFASNVHPNDDPEADPHRPAVRLSRKDREGIVSSKADADEITRAIRSCYDTRLSRLRQSSKTDETDDEELREIEEQAYQAASQVAVPEEPPSTYAWIQNFLNQVHEEFSKM